MKTLLQAARMLLALTVLTGVLYPLVVTGVAGVFCPRQAEGSLCWRHTEAVGSELVGQDFTAERYVWSRPSAGSYATLPAAASNLPPSSRALADAVAARTTRLRLAHGVAAAAALPDELLHASGSGLDPHISPAAARLQAGRVAAARGMPRQEVERLITACTEGPQFGLLGEWRLNVLKLNLALDDSAALER
jgi:potassium-transporting ATPase KdpC subunit